MAATLALVAGGILVFNAREARRAGDLELRLRAESLATDLLRTGDDRRGRRTDDLLHLDDDAHRLERAGVPAYILPVEDGQVRPSPPGAIPDLPNVEAAAAALAARAGRFATVRTAGGQARLYSLPVLRGGQPVAVVQTARSRYFVETALARVLLAVLGLGAGGLVLSAGAGFWLAGRTLRPIAQAMERQRRFTADASHELRTPLTLIRGNAELLSRHPDRPIREYGDVVQDIIIESDRLGRLVADLLTLARADEGRLQLALTDVDLSAMTAALVREFEPLAAAKGLTLRAEIAPGLHVRGDADRLRQLGVILLDNAVRYTQSGVVTLRLTGAHHGAVLSVSDTGPGIAPEHLPHIFERFYRADPARSSDQGGSGLGLAIARWIAEAHGGRIEVTSAPGRGSTFSVRLPPRPPSRSLGPRDGARPPGQHRDATPGRPAADVHPSP